MVLLAKNVLEFITRLINVNEDMFSHVIAGKKKDLSDKNIVQPIIFNKYSSQRVPNKVKKLWKPLECFKTSRRPPEFRRLF